MESKTVVDSSVLVAFLASSDNQHQKARGLLKSLNGLAIPEYVLLETATVLRNRDDNEIAASLIDHILSNSGVWLLYSTPRLFFETMVLFREERYPKLSFVDVALLILARQYEVITFDRALARAIRRDQQGQK